MSATISNNRLFSADFFTEGWTKKDWVVNLFPLGGVASVAYEMGFACFCSRDQTTKISQDFFKSPAQTTLKKIAQCLWVPIVICGALKLISLIVTACWNRCFPPAADGLSVESQVPEPASEDACERVLPVPLPDDVVRQIFFYLDMNALATTRRVCTEWKTFADTPVFWQKAIYEKFAFNSRDWVRWDGGRGILEGLDSSEEHLTLPENIADQLRLSYKAFPGKSIMQTHVLVRMPAGLTINKLGELAKIYFPNNAHGYGHISGEIVNELGDKSSGDEPVWLLMTRDILKGSRNQSYTRQQAIVANLGQGQMGYEVPTTLEAATCVLAEYVKSNRDTRLLGDSPCTYTHCQERVRACQVLVGGFAPSGLRVSRYAFDYYSIGVAALRKL